MESVAVVKSGENETMDKSSSSSRNKRASSSECVVGAVDHSKHTKWMEVRIRKEQSEERWYSKDNHITQSVFADRCRVK